MLTVDALLKRLCLSTLAGLGVSLVTAAVPALIAGVAVFYVLLIIHSTPTKPWPPA